MTELWGLIQEWLDAEPSRTIGYLASVTAADGGKPLSRNTLYALQNRVPKEPPRRRTLEAIARGIGKPYRVVRDAAYRDAGQRIVEEPTDDPELLALVDQLADASPDARRAAVAAAVAAVRALDK